MGWPWDILGVCYSAPASSITLNNNCVQASIYTQKDGGTRVYVPEHQPIRVKSSVETVSKTIQKSRHCDLDLLANPDNHYELKGCLVEREKPLPLKFAVQDPERYTSQNISTLLKQLGIELKGKIKIGSAPQRQRKLMALHQSKPLPDLLDDMLKHSDNLIADTLTKTLGAKFLFNPEVLPMVQKRSNRSFSPTLASISVTHAWKMDRAFQETTVFLRPKWQKSYVISGKTKKH